MTLADKQAIQILAEAWKRISSSEGHQHRNRSKLQRAISYLRSREREFYLSTTVRISEDRPRA